jgi:glycosyltransferase involved in cell wall biosynthesis
LQRAPLIDLLINASYCCSVLHHRFALPIPEPLRYGFRSTYLSQRDLVRSRADLIFSYERFPTRTPLPVVWQTGPTYTEHLLARGSDRRRIEQQIEWKRACAAKARLIVVPTRWGAERVAAMLEGFDEKLRVVPFFLPHMSFIARQRIAAKAADPTCRLTFIGRQARRKGLDLVIAAFERLDTLYPERFRLTIVSGLIDGPVEIPRKPNLELIEELRVAEVQELLARSHFLLMPSRFESFGWVYLEAMAQGAIALATEAPVQAELLAQGRAGLLTEPTPEAIVTAIEQASAKPEVWLQRALDGYDFAHAEFSPAAVAAKLRGVFEEALVTG